MVKLYVFYQLVSTSRSGFLLGIFSDGAKSIVMQISFVMQIFLFSDQGLEGKSLREETASGGATCTCAISHKEKSFGVSK